MSRHMSRLFSDQVSKPLRLCGSHNLPQVYTIDHLVSYVLYHTDQVSPDIRDMISKRFT